MHKDMEGRGRLFYTLLLPAFFSGLLVLYLRFSSMDIVSSDYIRLINSYLPDTMNPDKFFVPDILTRIPISFPLRTINVELFGFSVVFDRLLGLLGLGLSAIPLALFSLRARIFVRGSLLPPILCLFFLHFGLNKWELLLNGSGYAHFLSFAIFYAHFLLLDRFLKGEEKRGSTALLFLLPWISLLVAGPYLIVYLLTLVPAYSFLLLREASRAEKDSSLLEEKRESAETGKAQPRPSHWMMLLILSVLLPLFLYILSNHFAVYEYSGAEKRTLFSLLREFPSFPIRFTLNGFASMLLSGESLEELLSQGELSQNGIYLMGGVTAFSYLFSIWLYLKRGYYRETLFPALLILHGLGSHAIVLLSRFIFQNPDYAWQSRYALQYESGILGILLLCFLLLRDARAVAPGEEEDESDTGGIFLRKAEREERECGGWAAPGRAARCLALLLPLTFFLGNCYTTVREIRKIPYRRQSYERMTQTAWELESFSDEELQQIFEYHHGGGRIERAFRILREGKLNVYRALREGQEERA